jgi:hypothetical protein
MNLSKAELDMLDWLRHLRIAFWQGQNDQDVVEDLTRISVEEFLKRTYAASALDDYRHGETNLAPYADGSWN